MLLEKNDKVSTFNGFLFAELEKASQLCSCSAPFEQTSMITKKIARCLKKLCVDQEGTALFLKDMRFPGVNPRCEMLVNSSLPSEQG